MKNNLKLLSLVLLLLIYLVFAHITHIYIPCIFHEITGFLCPGCGITRMIISLLNGNIEEAFHYNQLLFLSIPIFLILIIDLIICNFREKISLYKKLPNYIYYIYIVLLIIFMIIRNIIPSFSI